MADPDEEVKDATNIFTDVNGEDILWEPGVVAWTNLKVANKGSLALKYQLAINFANATKNTNGDTLAKVLKVGFVNGGITGATRDAVLAEVDQWKEMASFVQDGTLDAADHKDDIYGVVIYWEPSANDNDFNLNNGQTGIMEIDLGIKLVATQLNFELDSFDKDYDAGVRYPLEKATYAEGSIEGYEVTVHIPAGAPEPADDTGYYITISNYSYTNESSEATLSFDMKLMDSMGEVPSSTMAYDVEIKLPHPFINEDSIQVFHNNVAVTDVTYDKETGTVRFTTTSFSPFEIKYTDSVDPSYELDYENDGSQYTIRKGMFVGVNPANFDTSLAEDGSEYIAVDFVKDDVKYYVVSERATTVFVTPDATAEYVGENETFNASNVDFRNNQSGLLGQLYDVNKAKHLCNNEHTTIYLLPGTYNEASTVYVRGSADIIGLGDTDEVKVIKGYSTGSNQHLFNCAGEKEEYIQVTLRNLYLDASEYNYKKATDVWGRDNAAVQSIRKTKVKCYDLTVVKNSAKSDQCAFYVNANNSANGAYQHAYMYVENCTVTVRNTVNVVSTLNGSKGAAGMKWYFYHSGLMCNGAEYTTNIGNNKNIAMSASDWTWD